MPKRNKTLKRKNKKMSIKGGDPCAKFMLEENFPTWTLHNLKAYKNKIYLNDCNESNPTNFTRKYLDNLSSIIAEKEKESKSNPELLRSDSNSTISSLSASVPSTRSNSLDGSQESLTSSEATTKSNPFSMSMPKIPTLGISDYLNKRKDLKTQKEMDQKLKNMSDLELCQYNLKSSMEKAEEWEQAYHNFVSRTKQQGFGGKSHKRRNTSKKTRRKGKLAKRKI